MLISLDFTTAVPMIGAVLALVFVFDGGVLSTMRIAALRMLDGELAAFRFCIEDEASGLLRPYVWRRAHAVFEALRTERVAYLQDGRPASSA